mmetsp:Transcript_20072/g.37957  ORF Transcript_20072/g.37957 Transcript_20072/m.37957 type:complete len:427 (-) Transcript_20072:34-1314(-)
MLQFSAASLFTAFGLGIGVEPVVSVNDFFGPEYQDRLLGSESLDLSLLQVFWNFSSSRGNVQYSATDHHELTSRIPSRFEHAAQSGAASSKGSGVSPVTFSSTFAIVALPDTQYYSKYHEFAEHFTNQTEWIKDQVMNKGNPRNIVFVSHLGDVVHNVADQQWIRANASMSVLGSPGGSFVLPFSILPGNHDYPHLEKANDCQDFVSHFGPQRFLGAGWYGGADPSGKNSFQLFSGGGFNFIHIALEWRPHDNTPKRNVSPLEWASDVLHMYPGMPAIISTHEYLYDDNENVSDSGFFTTGGRTPSGQILFDTFVTKHDQVFMVLCGHFHRVSPMEYGGKWHQISMNDFDHPVIEVLQDFQDYPSGGHGWLRIITFNPAAGQLHFEIYSPSLDRYKQDSVNDSGRLASVFTLPFNFTSRLSKVQIH